MTTFEDRKKNLFEHLDAAESRENFATKRKQFVPKLDSDANRVNTKKLKTETKHLRGKESIFKRPEIPLPGCLRPRRIPDYRKNPSKWTYYSLEDVPEMTERSNAEAAAMCFAECKKDKNQAPEVKADLNDKVLFKLPVLDEERNIVKVADEPENFKSFKGSKIVLPQYFVGQKKEKRKTTKPSKVNSGNCNLKLSHLEEEESEEDD